MRVEIGFLMRCWCSIATFEFWHEFHLIVNPARLPAYFCSQWASVNPILEWQISHLTGSWKQLPNQCNHNGPHSKQLEWLVFSVITVQTFDIFNKGSCEVPLFRTLPKVATLRLLLCMTFQALHQYWLSLEGDTFSCLFWCSGVGSSHAKFVSLFSRSLPPKKVDVSDKVARTLVFFLIHKRHEYTLYLDWRSIISLSYSSEQKQRVNFDEKFFMLMLTWAHVKMHNFCSQISYFFKSL